MAAAYAGKGPIIVSTVTRRRLELANRKSAVLITTDKDFGEIVFRQGRSSGAVVPIRLEGLSPETKARIVSRAINARRECERCALSIILRTSVRGTV
jgi:predicted nuclease of predicted toxin-antitoxin system